MIISLEAKIYEKGVVPDDFKVLNKPPAGGLPVKLGLAKQNWPSNGLYSITRRYVISWDNLDGKEPESKLESSVGYFKWSEKDKDWKLIRERK